MRWKVDQSALTIFYEVQGHIKAIVHLPQRWPWIGSVNGLDWVGLGWVGLGPKFPDSGSK